jgi:Fic family protein
MANLNILTENIVKSSAIEGEHLSHEQVRSSLAKRLGIDVGTPPTPDRHIEGLVDVMLDATSNYTHPLTSTRLYGWHRALFPTGYSGMYKINVGAYRTDQDGPMQVGSGAYGRQTVHYQAPDATVLASEMSAFTLWFNQTSHIDGVLKAALAHFWFITLHPFDDGNGQLARTITDMALAQSDHCKMRFYSMSAQISNERNEYYKILESSQKGTLDITAWIKWFLNCLGNALKNSESILHSVLVKDSFWRKHAMISFNERQRNILTRLLDGFEGNLTTSQWAKIAKCSQDTALRDIEDLISKNILKKNPGSGRSTSYSMVVS